MAYVEWIPPNDSASCSVIPFDHSGRTALHNVAVTLACQGDVENPLPMVVA